MKIKKSDPCSQNYKQSKRHLVEKESAIQNETAIKTEVNVKNIAGKRLKAAIRKKNRTRDQSAMLCAKKLTM